MSWWKKGDENTCRAAENNLRFLFTRPYLQFMHIEFQRKAVFGCEKLDST